MGARVFTREPSGAGAPPAAPPPDVPVDEGPMRRELLRQIALLDADLSARSAALPAGRTTARRGPAVLPTAELERIRDELLRALEQ